MGNCLPVFGGSAEPSSPPATHTSYTNPLALSHNSSYVNNLFERSRRIDGVGDVEEANAEQQNRIRSLLSQIPAISYRPEMGDIECAICMGELDTSHRLRYLPCMHLFHVECVDEWLVRSFNCPSCLEPVDSTMLSSLTAHTTMKLSDIASTSASH